MSLLQKLLLLSHEERQRIFQLYRNVGFPPEIDLFLVREKCAEWIEGNLWNNDMDPDKSEHENKIRHWFDSFSTQLETYIRGAGHEPLKLTSALTYFKTLSPSHLYRVLKNCLNQELIAHGRMRSEKIVSLGQKIRQAESWSMERIQVWNALVSEETQMEQLLEWSLASQEHAGTSERIQEMLRNCDRSISQKRLEYSGLERRINEIIGKSLQETQELVSNLNDLGQKLVPNQEESLGMTYDDFLGNFFQLKEILHQTDQLITNVIQSSHQPTTVTFIEQRHNVGLLIGQITPIFNTLFIHSLTLEKCPDSIIKQEKKFDVDLCCRAPKTMNLVLPSGRPTMNVIVINEIDAASLCRNPLINPELPSRSCEVTYERGSPTYDEHLSRLTVSLTDIKIPSRPTDPRNRPTPVLRQKFYLFFYCDVSMNDRPFRLWTLSFPFVYTTNVSQVLEASCTIFWDTYLKGTTAFDVRDEVPVSIMTQALANYIRVETNASWTLSKEQCTYFAQKILQTETYSAETIVSRTQFENGKDRMTGVTFWEWFYTTVKLIKDHLSVFWENGYISFMTRQQAEDLIHRFSRPGLFILRCSDTYVGLSITWNEQGKGPFSVQPLDDKSFLIKNLTERLHDISNFTQVMYQNGFSWSCKSKQEAFPYTPAIVRTGRQEQLDREPGMKAVKPYIRTGMVWALLHFGLDTVN